MNKDFIPQNIPFFPIGLKPCKVNLSEIGLQFSSESLTALPTKSKLQTLLGMLFGGNSAAA